MYKDKPKAPAQWKAADDEGIPYVAILAPAELAAGTVRIKEQIGREGEREGDEKGEEVRVDDVVRYLKDKLARS